MIRLEHDPELAKRVYKALTGITRWSPNSYWMWLRLYVKPLAEANNIEIVMQKKTKLVMVAMPEELVEKLDEIARAKGWSRSELIRRALWLFVSAWEESTSI